ncbi:cupin domain-containing protein [Labrys wisconsinensis]|uniref:Quercetin dioxygenase-like cupin family protein n=1 Tax=Labrys wisconsinensis TaxID=425677 RepID=A0ABU0JFX5_9HYPH|nr:cupin domain-containing protein [Labrys wisconsinensis]MDQ0473183.1 quercetin dioxygenase-like cupin family protein [Labrys wisconsinensis]
MRIAACIAAAGLALLAAGARAEESAAVKPVVVTTILSTTTTAAGQPIRLPQGDITLSVSDYRIAPGARLPVHMHPFPRYAYVLEGTIAVTLPDSGQRFVYHQGDVIVEVVGLWHYGVNEGTTPVRLIVFDQVPGNTPATVLKP